MQGHSRRRYRVRKRRLLTVVTIGILALILITTISLINAKGRSQPEQILIAAQETASVEPTLAVEETVETLQTQVANTAAQEHSNSHVNLASEPMSKGYLPVLKKAVTDEKIIAITVDDCFQTENLREIVDTALQANGKLTIFPIGKLLSRSRLQEVLLYAHDNGFEIENHTYSHSGLHDRTDRQMEKEVFRQDAALDKMFGADYRVHFLRPKGGDSHQDLRTHAYSRQLGYYGIAHWSVSGNSNINKLKKSLAPGEIYLFHTTDKDLKLLKQFIPYAAEQGYKLVTLNEMFGYEENAVVEIDEPLDNRTPPPLEPYEKDYKMLKRTTYAYGVYEVQVKLAELGFFDKDPTGTFGKETEAAAKAWQKSVGYEPDGKLPAEQQKKLLGVE